MIQDCTAILILTYNTSTDTINCIRSIEAYNTAPIKFIIVDNGSPDPEAIVILDRFLTGTGRSYRRWSDADTQNDVLPYYSLLASRTNDGYARGNNKGLRLAQQDSSISNILILNNDILFTEDILPSLLRFQRENEDCGLITPLIISREGSIDHCCARRVPTNWEIIRLFGFFGRDCFRLLSKANKRQKILLSNPELIERPSFPVDVPSGACMLIDKMLFLQIGGFDPDTFLYFEENILYKKLQTVSRISYCIPSVKCIHLGAGSTQNQNSHFLQRFNLESADIYLSRYGHLSFLQRCVWRAIKGLWYLKFKITAKHGQ